MWPRRNQYDDHGDRLGRPNPSALPTGHATTMTDDTDHDDHGDDERAVSLPLIDTFAALEAELAAKEDRIERLESELDRRYLDPDGEEPGTEAPAESDDGEPTAPEDWEPATDPLEDTGAPTGEGEDEGVTPSAEVDEPAASTSRSHRATETAASADSELAPVRTVSSRERESRERESPTREEATAGGEEFGVTMEEATSDLTGGSLGSSAGAATTRPTGDEESDSDSGTDQSPPPDPTADRGERLSRLVRRAERREEGEVVEAFVEGIDALDDVTREMLAHYREAGDASPVDAHVAAGGSGERRYAYARNRTLRKAGVVEHDGAGRYRYALPELVEEAFDGQADGQTVADAVAAIESAAGLD